MKFELVELAEISNRKTKVYSVIINDTDQTLFDQFIAEHEKDYPEEIDDILARLLTMAKKTGAQEYFFKLNEGRPGDGVSALYDLPAKSLRLYCIRFGQTTVILGGGGPKPKNIRSYQESILLNTQAQLMKDLSKAITAAMRDPTTDLTLADDGTFEGDCIIEF